MLCWVQLAMSNNGTCYCVPGTRKSSSSILALRLVNAHETKDAPDLQMYNLRIRARE